MSWGAESAEVSRCWTSWRSVLDPVLIYKRRPELQKFPAHWLGVFGDSKVIYDWRQQNPYPKWKEATISLRLADAAGHIGYVIQSLKKYFKPRSDDV